MFKPVFKNEGTSQSHPRLCRFLSERGTCRTGPGAPCCRRARVCGVAATPGRLSQGRRRLPRLTRPHAWTISSQRKRRQLCLGPAPLFTGAEEKPASPGSAPRVPRPGSGPVRRAPRPDSGTLRSPRCPALLAGARSSPSPSNMPICLLRCRRGERQKGD